MKAFWQVLTGLEIGDPFLWLLCLVGFLGLLTSVLFVAYVVAALIHFVFKPDLGAAEPTVPECRMPVMRPLPIKTGNQGPLKRYLVYMLVPRTWKLLQNWQYNYYDKQKEAYVELVVPKGFKCDVASIPRPFRAFFNPSGLLLLPAILHDYAFQYNKLWQVAENGEIVPYGPGDCCCSRTQKRFWDELLFNAGMQINGFRLVNKMIWWIRFLSIPTWKKYRQKEETARLSDFDGDCLCKEPC